MKDEAEAVEIVSKSNCMGLMMIPTVNVAWI